MAKVVAKYRYARQRYKNWQKEFLKKKYVLRFRIWRRSWIQADVLLRAGMLLWAMGMYLLLPFAFFLAILGVAVVVFSCVLPPPKKNESDQ